MNVKQLMATGYWRNKSDIARELGISRQAVSQWGDTREIVGESYLRLRYEILPAKGMKRNEIKELV